MKTLTTLSALVLATQFLGACKSPQNELASLKTTEQNRYSQLFRMVDADGDGKITPEEFQAHYASVTWLYFDKNGDGVITYKEWSVDGLSPERLAWFKSLDADGDGQVSREEFERAISPEGVDEFFALMDKNGDGVITRAELEIH